MILLCNGDSWTQGDSPAQQINWKAKPNLDWYNIIPDFGELFTPYKDNRLYKFYDSNVWPKVLGKKLGVETWNCGKGGSSNDKIIRTTIHSVEYLESLGKKDLFVVIGLTSLTRFSNIETEDNRLVYNEIHLSHELMKNITNLDVVYYNHLVNIINIQNYLKMKNIPYLIFNTFDVNMESDLTKHKLYDNIDLNNIYNKDFKPHFRNFIDNKFNTNWGVDGKYYQTIHPTDFSHIEWGNELYRYIKENYNV
tara:strand:- start:46 stop:798 length:753 start_codon:yes stop_codon:yes gene_type:complete